MRVKVLFFGQLKDITGLSEDSAELAAGASLEAIFDHYAAQYPRMRDLRPSIVIARNHQFAEASTPVAEGDEIAFLPPVSGGALKGGRNIFELTRQPIDSASVRERVLTPEDGAVVVFEGVVRNNTKGRATKFLDYECYEPMALKTMQQIGEEIAQSHAITQIAMVHRLGRMEISEISVLIVVSAPHRKPAFDAAFEGINRLKKLVPIWKKEHFADGEVWVDGEWDDSVLQR
ncbi:MAG TPA: molybdenum cofactor biosynthesis protein MoaE [Bryobacteraceae bacterium]|nr:molybdenum cofactor biosynthesis protein MoaE [Bryobacteraceae bacterium]